MNPSVFDEVQYYLLRACNYGHAASKFVCISDRSVFAFTSLHWKKLFGTA
jgi:hypothetical protein